MKNVKLIAEFGCNHQGDKDIAIDMIYKAKEIGNVWGIKFQKRDIEVISDKVKIIPRSLNNSFGKNYYEHRKALEFSPEDLTLLKEVVEREGMQFICSTFDENSIDDIVKLVKCKYIKLPSQLFTRKDLRSQLLKLKNKYNFKIMVSTGMHEWEEIEDNEWLNHADIIFHCISTYPTKITEMNLDTIRQLKNITDAKIGYSSHENEGIGIKLAVLTGAEYIERHFTLNTEMKGSDHGTVSSDPEEMKKIISDIEYAERILGTQNRFCKLKERKVRNIYRGF
jgi:N-acetylneuraminate synthase